MDISLTRELCVTATATKILSFYQTVDRICDNGCGWLPRASRVSGMPIVYQRVYRTGRKTGSHNERLIAPASQPNARL
jgi:hypothetical protein